MITHSNKKSLFLIAGVCAITVLARCGTEYTNKYLKLDILSLNGEPFSNKITSIVAISPSPGKTVTQTIYDTTKNNVLWVNLYLFGNDKNISSSNPNIEAKLFYKNEIILDSTLKWNELSFSVGESEWGDPGNSICSGKVLVDTARNGLSRLVLY